MSLKDTAYRLAVLKALRDAVAAEEANARVFALGDLTAAAEDMGVRSVDVSLPDGTKIATLSLGGGTAKATVVDEAKFTAWVQANHPTEIETVVRVRPAYVQAVLAKAVDGYAVFAGGEVVDGVGPAVGSRSAVVRYTTDGREAVARAWQRGELTGISPYPELEVGA
jgi:hypothetical protein